jgi:hypothetical protein
MLLGEAGEEAEGRSGLLRGVAADVAVRQRLLQFSHTRGGDFDWPILRYKS